MNLSVEKLLWWGPSKALDEDKKKKKKKKFFLYSERVSRKIKRKLFYSVEKSTCMRE